MLIVIHANPTQPHQQAYAEYFRQGFKRHGLTAEITPNIGAQADIHVVLGPHYAKDQWLGHERVILLDREYYHGNFTDHPRNMDWTSIGWMRPDGGRHFQPGVYRKPAVIEHHPQGEGSIFLRDYGGPMGRADTIRHHPAERPSPEPLRQALLRHKRAIGYNTTALVTAGLLGLEIECKSKINIMFAKNWLQLLPWADWHYSEIISGDVWAHLRWSQGQLNTQ